VGRSNATSIAAHLFSGPMSLYRKDSWLCSYLPVPKNATTSMIKWFGGKNFTSDSVWSEVCQKCCEIRIHRNNLCEDCGTKSSTTEIIVKSSVDNLINNDIKLFILRNPLKRIISIFFHVLQEVDKGNASFRIPKFYFDDVDKFSMSSISNRMNTMRVVDWDSEVALSLVERFNLFLDSLQNNTFYDLHVFPQIFFLTERGLSFEDVEIILFDTLGSDLNSFCEKYDFMPTKELEIINVTKEKFGLDTQQKEIQEYIDSKIDIQNKIKEIYKEDWDLYTKIKNSRS